jgi:hypothetical protein
VAGGALCSLLLPRGRKPEPGTIVMAH